jgi:hypothetical protein
MALQAAFMFLAEGADAARHRMMMCTPQVDLTIVGVANYAETEAGRGRSSPRG